MVAHVTGGMYRWDENAISVLCATPGCEKRIHNDVRCSAHGGRPDYEWSTDPYGETVYSAHPGGADGTTTTG